MKRSLLVILMLATVQLCMAQSPSIYSFKIDSISGSHQIDFAAFQGKKILIVNTATADSNTTQFAELEQLYQIYKDSVVIIAVSSNSFNTEPRTNSQIASFCSSTYTLHFPVGAKIEVTGNNANDLYKWLTQKTQNTLMNSIVHGAFQKYLINKQGKLVGSFSRNMSPMSQSVRHAIEIL